MLGQKSIESGVGKSGRDKERIVDSNRETVQLHVASYFLVAKSEEEQKGILASYGLDAYDPIWITKEIKEKLWNQEAVDKRGLFIFPPKTLILAHTLESMQVPSNQSYYFRQYFVDEKTRKTLPLTTHVSAPWIQPQSSGPQTYEIINESDRPLTIKVARLVCIAEISYLTGPVSRLVNEPSNFRTQKTEEISLGDREDWEFRVIREALLERGFKPPWVKS